MPLHEEFAATFKALGDPLRLRLLGMLPGEDGEDSLGVCELARKVGISQPCLSHHLSVLKGAGLVDCQKEGCSAFYFVNREQVNHELDRFRTWMEQQ